MQNSSRKIIPIFLSRYFHKYSLICSTQQCEVTLQMRNSRIWKPKRFVQDCTVGKWDLDSRNRTKTHLWPQSLQIFHCTPSIRAADLDILNILFLDVHWHLSSAVCFWVAIFFCLFLHTPILDYILSHITTP